MNAIIGVVKDRQVLVPVPEEWPEGCEVVVMLQTADDLLRQTEDKPETPEEIADWLRWYDSLEPLEFTPEEEAGLASWRKKVKENTIANMHKRVEGLFE